MTFPKALLILLAVSGMAAAERASAQSWTVAPGATHALTPPSIAGDQLGPSAISCIDGQLIMEHGYGIGIDVFTSRGDAATISVDGKTFSTKAVQLAHGTGIVLTPGAIGALKAGRRMEIAFPSTDRTARATFTLTGSRKALEHMEARCGMARAAASPAASGASSGQEAGDIQRLQIALAEELTAECRQIGGRNIIFDHGAVRTEAGRDPAHPDVVFNFHHILCNGATNALLETGVGYCGAGPCLQRRFAYKSGRYVPAGEFYQ